ncbi:hypothetical protein JTB14_031718 [Gonioctena quinquepunctata]|nr:hypothetical protein JTB14_031718 [Gonioctena quinquepunctata]
MEPCSEQEEKTQIFGWPNRGNLRGGNYTKSRILTSLHIPDVECEPHNSRKPEVYSSMKVTLKKQFLKQACKVNDLLLWYHFLEEGGTNKRGGSSSPNVNINKSPNNSGECEEILVNNYDLLLSNISGLNQYKIDDLTVTYSNSNLKILCFTETWIPMTISQIFVSQDINSSTSLVDLNLLEEVLLFMPIKS